MNTVTICQTCGNIIRRHYRYCPFCGNKKQDDERLEDMVNDSFAKIEKVRTVNYLSRLNKLADRLATLEKELDALVPGKK